MSADTKQREYYEKMLADMPKPQSFHACENEGANCIDFVEAIFGGKQGRVCWCECHPWNQPKRSGHDR